MLTTTSPKKQITSSLKVLHYTSLILLLAASTASAALYTYELTNVPGVQDGNTLDGNITIDTAGGTENGVGSGEFFIGHSAIVVWNFTVTSSGGGSYSGSSTGINPSATGSGGSFALYATPASLTLVAAASLTLESDLVTPGADVSVSWIYDTPFYFSGGTATGGSVWLNSDRASLDAAFPANPSASATSWTFATEIPEPSISLLCMAGVSLLLRRSRRGHCEGRSCEPASRS